MNMTMYVSMRVYIPVSGTPGAISAKLGTREERGKRCIVNCIHDISKKPPVPP